MGSGLVCVPLQFCPPTKHTESTKISKTQYIKKRQSFNPLCSLKFQSPIPNFSFSSLLSLSLFSLSSPLSTLTKVLRLRESHGCESDELFFCIMNTDLNLFFSEEDGSSTTKSTTISTTTTKRFILAGYSVL